MVHRSFVHGLNNQAICHLPKKSYVINDLRINLVKMACLTNVCTHICIQILKDHFRMLYFHPMYNI